MALLYVLSQATRFIMRGTVISPTIFEMTAMDAPGLSSPPVAYGIMIV